jgi:AcrR family transcriptional regulator
MTPVASPTSAPSVDRQPPPGPRARERLIRHATAIFAAKGFAAASTREICEAAGVNIASIHYYFGDKAGLYRETLLGPIAEVITACDRFDDPALSFEESMRVLLGPILGLGPSAKDQAFEVQVMRLHLREMLEPSGAFREVVEQTIAPAHRALCGLLARHCGLEAPDDDIHQLAFALVAMANDYCLSREMMKLLAPGVLSRPRAGEQVLDRLLGYARALLDHEIARQRGFPIKPSPARSPTGAGT